MAVDQLKSPSSQAKKKQQQPGEEIKIDTVDVDATRRIAVGGRPTGRAAQRWWNELETPFRLRRLCATLV